MTLLPLQAALENGKLSERASLGRPWVSSVQSCCNPSFVYLQADHGGSTMMNLKSVALSPLVFQALGT